MKAVKPLFLLLAVSGFAGNSLATPVQYQFTASSFIEVDGDGNVIPGSGNLIGAGATASVTFDYDAATPASSVDYDYSYAGFGLMSFYNDAAGNFHGNVGGHQFGATVGAASVSDSAPGAATMDLVSVLAGDLGHLGYQVGSGFQNFSIGDFSLVGFSIYSSGPNNYVASQALPNQLGNGPTMTGMTLTFVDSNNTVRSAVFFSGDIAAVPIPATGLLFGSGLMGLAMAARQRFKKPSMI